jgi:hypothetical protein
VQHQNQAVVEVKTLYLQRRPGLAELAQDVGVANEQHGVMLRLQTVMVFLEKRDRERVSTDQCQPDRYHRLHPRILDVIGIKAAILRRFCLKTRHFTGQVFIARPFLAGGRPR